MSLVIGHRGAPRLARENTVESFLAAGRVGAHMVELDVRRTGDGALVVHHDASLADGRVIAEIARTDLPGFVPTLAEALAACAGMTVNVEIKNSPRDPDFDATNAIATRTVDDVEDAGWLDRVIVSSFNLATIDAIADRVATAWLLLPNADVASMIDTTVEHNHDALHPYDTSVTRDVVEAAHGRGLQLNVWTVDDHDRIRELASWNVDGIVTNVPDDAVRLLAGHH